MINPTLNYDHDATKMYLMNECQAIIAFGGGSPLDCAKEVAGLIAIKKVM